MIIISHYELIGMRAAIDAGSLKQLKVVFHGIVKCVNELTINQCGNHVIQHLLDCRDTDITDTIMHNTVVQLQFSEQKCLSNDVERCIGPSEAERKEHRQSTHIYMRRIIVREVLNKVGELISDKCGNYCLQSALITFQTVFHLLQEFALIKLHLNSLRWIKLMKQQMVSTMATDGISRTHGISINMNSMTSMSMNYLNPLNSIKGHVQMRVQMLLNAGLGKHDYVFTIAIESVVKTDVEKFVFITPSTGTKQSDQLKQQNMAKTIATE